MSLPIINKVQSLKRQRERLRQARSQKSEVKSKTLPPLSLVEFIKEFWSVVEPSVKYQHSWHIEAIALHLEATTRGEIRKLVVNIPPGFMKSMLVGVFFPAWVWGEIDPSIRWLFSSYSGTLSTRDSIKCRRIIQSSSYRQRYPQVRLSPDANLKTYFDNTATGFRQASSTGAVGTGTRARYIITDDPHKVSEAESDKIRSSVVSWWAEEMSTRGDDPQKAVHIIVMQRVHFADVAGWALDNGYEHLCLPGEYDPTRHCVTSINWSDPRSSEGEPLWGDRFSTIELQKLKSTLGSYAYAAQIQQLPTPREGGILKGRWWRYTEVPRVFSRLVWSWDTAFKTSNFNDPTVGLLLGEFGQGYFVCDVFCDRLEYPELKRMVVALYERSRSDAVVVEDKASGQSLIQELQRTTKLPIIPQKVDSDKIARVNAIAPLIESGRVFLPESAPWLADFLTETSQFPNSAHDDQVDALTQALAYMVRSPSIAVSDFIAVGKNRTIEY